MTKNIIESWITTTLGGLVGIFSGFALWFDKTSVWGSIAMWALSAILIFANEKKISTLFDKIPKFK